MNDDVYNALQISLNGSKVSRKVVGLRISSLPPGDVLIRVHYSALNYKDALSANGDKGVTKNYPHTPGIDAAGVVVDSKTKMFDKGDHVFVTGFDLGMNTSGGFGEYIRVPAKWVFRVNEGADLKYMMTLGTAGFTAAMGLYKLKILHKLKGKKILVTGATGGVGSIAVKLFSSQGFSVIASTGKNDKHDFLKDIGASEIISRNEVIDKSDKGLLKGRWDGVFDTVGGDTLSTVLRQTNTDGAVVTCGNVAGADFNGTVYPFILRNISLYGVASAETEMNLRQKIWKQLVSEWKLKFKKSFVKEVTLNSIGPEIDNILRGEICGRVVLKMI